MARVFTSRDATCGSSACSTASSASTRDAEQRWPAYAASRARLLGRQRRRLSTRCSAFQAELPLSLGLPRRGRPRSAFNTAASFVTNTNWQSYSGESTMGYLVQMAGLAVQNFVSAAVGIAVAVALDPRASPASRTDRIGNFWVDLVRGVVRVLLPLAVVAAIVLIAGGRRPELHRGAPTSTTLAGRHADDPGGPVASPGGHQGARHQRRRLLQRQLRAPVREPERRGPTCSRSSCCC